MKVWALRRALLLQLLRLQRRRQLQFLQMIQLTMLSRSQTCRPHGHGEQSLAARRSLSGSRLKEPYSTSSSDEENRGPSPWVAGNARACFTILLCRLLVPGQDAPRQRLSRMRNSILMWSSSCKSGPSVVTNTRTRLAIKVTEEEGRERGKPNLRPLRRSNGWQWQLHPPAHQRQPRRQTPGLQMQWVHSLRQQLRLRQGQPEAPHPHHQPQHLRLPPLLLVSPPPLLKDEDKVSTLAAVWRRKESCFFSQQGPRGIRKTWDSTGDSGTRFVSSQVHPVYIFVAGSPEVSWRCEGSLCVLGKCISAASARFATCRKLTASMTDGHASLALLGSSCTATAAGSHGAAPQQQHCAST